MSEIINPIVDLDEIDETQTGTFVPEEPTEPEPIAVNIGVVVECDRLNIRKAPNKTAKVVATAKCGTELCIDVDNSTEEWYCVCTAAGVEGFCMKDYVEVKQ